MSSELTALHPGRVLSNHGCSLSKQPRLRHLNNPFLGKIFRGSLGWNFPTIILSPCRSLVGRRRATATPYVSSSDERASALHTVHRSLTIRLCVLSHNILSHRMLTHAESDNDMSTEQTQKVFAQILEEHVAAAATEQVATADELMSLVLDIQAHDNVKFDECIASLLIAGAVARKRSIDYSAKTKAAKQTAANVSRYNAAVAQNPSVALNPKANATLMLAYSMITRQQYDAIIASLENSVASVETHEVSIAK